MLVIRKTTIGIMLVDQSWSWIQKKKIRRNGTDFPEVKVRTHLPYVHESVTEHTFLHPQTHLSKFVSMINSGTAWVSHRLKKKKKLPYIYRELQGKRENQRGLHLKTDIFIYWID